VSGKRRRRVEEVELVWEARRDLEPVKRELGRPKVGRKARRDGTAETPVPSFPSTGGISFSSPWNELAREHATRVQGGFVPDLETLAAAFRDWCEAKGIPLDVPNIEKTFVGFCRNYRPPGARR